MKYVLIVTGVTILLSLTVFLQLVAETMPPTSDAVPLIGENTSDALYVFFYKIMITSKICSIFSGLM